MNLPSLALATSGDGLPHKPGMADFFPQPFLFAGTPFAIDRIMMIRIIVVCLVTLIFGLFALRARLVPGRAQSAVELLLEFVEKSIAKEVLGEKDGRRYLPILTTVFVGVLFLNITGIIPGLNIAASSVLGIPLIFALFAYLSFIGAGIKKHGLRFFKNAVVVPGLPKLLYVLMVPIEILSTFIVRPATLTIRLLANMVAGHILLALCFWGTHVLFFYMAGVLKGLGVVTLGLSVAFMLFELFVAGLQAYIFALLTAVYIQLSVADEH